MAYLYKKPPSNYWWIKYLDFDVESPKWRGMSTRYKIDSNLEKPRRNSNTEAAVNYLLTINAQESKHRNDLILEGKLPTRKIHPWDDWAPDLLHKLYYNPATYTFPTNRSYWKSLTKFFKEKGITHPGLVTTDVLRAYYDWRIKNGACKNNAREGIKLLAVFLDVAEDKKWITSNPARSKCLWRELKKSVQKPAKPWSEHQVDTIREALESPEYKYGHMYVTFHMCLWLGIRHTQCQVPLDAFHLDRPIPIVDYPAQITRKGMTFNLVKSVKGREGQGYPQVIPDLFVPWLRDMIERRRALGEERLCDLPRWSEKVQIGPGKSGGQWRKLLDKFGFTDISVHGLRARWITLTRKSGVSKEVTMHAVNHTSEKVHDGYTHLIPEDSAAQLNAIAHIIGHLPPSHLP